MVVDFKTLQSKYVGSAASKNAKRLEFTLQMHAALASPAQGGVARDAADADACEGVEERAMSKKEQKKLVKGVKKLVDEISFLLTPPGQEGVRALVESEFTSHYAGALPSALQALQSALGVSSEAPAERDGGRVRGVDAVFTAAASSVAEETETAAALLLEPAAQNRNPAATPATVGPRVQLARPATSSHLAEADILRETVPSTPSRRWWNESKPHEDVYRHAGPETRGPTVVASTPVLANSTPVSCARRLPHVRTAS